MFILFMAIEPFIGICLIKNIPVEPAIFFILLTSAKTC